SFRAMLWAIGIGSVLRRLCLEAAIDGARDLAGLPFLEGAEDHGGDAIGGAFRGPSIPVAVPRDTEPQSRNPFPRFDPRGAESCAGGGLRRCISGIGNDLCPLQSPPNRMRMVERQALVGGKRRKPLFNGVNVATAGQEARTRRLVNSIETSCLQPRPI